MLSNEVKRKEAGLSYSGIRREIRRVTGNFLMIKRGLDVTFSNGMVISHILPERTYRKIKKKSGGLTKLKKNEPHPKYLYFFVQAKRTSL